MMVHYFDMIVRLLFLNVNTHAPVLIDFVGMLASSRF